MKRALGLTLVEVLVAAVILFAALSLSALALKSLRQNSAQAEKVIKMAEPVRMIVLTVQQQIRAKPEAELTGAGEAFKVSYSWHAAVVKTGSAPSRFDLDAGSITVPP